MYHSLQSFQRGDSQKALRTVPVHRATHCPPGQLTSALWARIVLRQVPASSKGGTSAEGRDLRFLAVSESLFSRDGSFRFRAPAKV